jgi:hypothetical protein
VRCIAPTWPLSAHAPVPDGVDLSASVTVRRITRFLEALDLRDFTVVANNTGGGLSSPRSVTPRSTSLASGGWR